MKRTIALVLALLMMGCCVACQPADDTGTTTTTAADTTTTTGADSTTVGDATTTVDSTETTTTVAMDVNTTTTAKKPTATTTTQSTGKAVTQLKYDLDIKGLPGTKSSELLTNPERGWYMEVTLNVADGMTMPGVSACGEAVDAIQWLRDKLTYYVNEKPQLIQVFFYLTNYHDKDLDAKAFENLQKYFDELRRLGVQTVTRFAYETPAYSTWGPTTEQMLRHMKQLKPFLEKNKDVIHVIQAGFIGLVGEWHHATYDHDRRVVLEAIVDMAPAGKLVQVRLASYKDVLKKDDPRRNRVSYHDDYLVGGEHAWSAVQSTNVPQYNMVLNDSTSMSLVGEMPWGAENYGAIDGFGMATWLQKFHYTAISVTHNYIENGPGDYEYEMTKWKKVAADKAALDENGLRYEESWLLDENGQPTNRSVFEYIRDYLGYYLTVSDVNATVSGKSITTKLSLKNYGFSAPHGMNAIQLVLLDNNGNVVAESESLSDMDSLQPGFTKTAEATLTASTLYAGYKVGIRFANDRGLTARLASDIPYENGINVLFTLS